MVAGHDDNGIVQLAGLFEKPHCCSDIAVPALDFKVVVGDITADHFVVGQEVGDVNLIHGDSALPATSFLVRPVRVARAKPEAERFCLIALPHEVLESICWPAGMLCIATRPEIKLAQGLAPVTDLIASIPKPKHEVRMLNIQDAMEVRTLPQAVELLAGEDRVPARRTGWTRNKRMLKENVFLCDAVERRGLHNLVPVHSRMWPPPIVSHAEQDIRSFVCEALRCYRNEKEQPLDTA